MQDLNINGAHIDCHFFNYVIIYFLWEEKYYNYYWIRVCRVWCMILIGTILVLYYLWFIQNVLLPILSPPEVITTLETSLLQAPNCTTCVFHWESVKHINTNCVQALKKLWKIGVICEMHLPNSSAKIYSLQIDEISLNTSLHSYHNQQFYDNFK